MNACSTYFGVFLKAKPYSLYVLFILFLTFMLNQLDRFALPITSIESAQTLEYGSKSCLKFKNASSDDGSICQSAENTDQDKCNSARNPNGTRVCQYTYNGQGIEYQVVSGPVFILVFTFTGIFLSIFADAFRKRRVLILAACLTWWSLMTLLTGFVTEFWQLAVLRFGLGIGQAGCNPIATSIIADYFSTELRGSALSIYNWGIYTGYSLSFAIGNQILKHMDWQYVYIIFGIPGFVVAVLIVLTIKQKEPEVAALSKRDEPEFGEAEEDIVEAPKEAEVPELTKSQQFLQVLKEFLKPSLILLCIAGSIRNAAGFVWANNNNQYYKFMGQTADQISQFLGVIPIVFGIIGSFVGGFVSDRVAKKADPSKRIWVLVLSQIAAAPFVAGVLFFDPPYSYYFLIPTYIIGEMWIGVCLSVVVELVPEKLRMTGVGVYFFIISNIGGNMQLLVPPFQTFFQNTFNLSELAAFRAALYIFYPGEYVIGSALFLLTLFVLKRDLQKTQVKPFEPEQGATDSNIDRAESSAVLTKNAVYESE